MLFFASADGMQSYVDFVQGSESMYYESSIESGSIDVRRKDLRKSSWGLYSDSDAYFWKKIELIVCG